MDKIILESMRFDGSHGVTDDERKQKQPFDVSVCVYIDTKTSGNSDLLEDTVDYTKIYHEVKCILEGTARKLLENIAEAISDKLLRDYPIQAVNIKITKLETKIESVVIPAGVEIYRSGRGNP